MSLHSIVQDGSGPVIVVLTVVAIAAFVTADLLRTTDRPASDRVRRFVHLAWPLSLITLAIVIVRVAVLS